MTFDTGTWRTYGGDMAVVQSTWAGVGDIPSMSGYIVHNNEVTPATWHTTGNLVTIQASKSFTPQVLHGFKIVAAWIPGHNPDGLDNKTLLSGLFIQAPDYCHVHLPSWGDLCKWPAAYTDRLEVWNSVVNKWIPLTPKAEIDCASAYRTTLSRASVEFLVTRGCLDNEATPALPKTGKK